MYKIVLFILWFYHSTMHRPYDHHEWTILTLEQENLREWKGDSRKLWLTFLEFKIHFVSFKVFSQTVKFYNQVFFLGYGFCPRKGLLDDWISWKKWQTIYNFIFHFVSGHLFCWFICRRSQFGLHSLERMSLWQHQLPAGNLFATTYLFWKCCLKIYYLVHCTYFQPRFMERKSITNIYIYLFQFFAMVWCLWLVFPQVISADLQMWHMCKGSEQVIDINQIGHILIDRLIECTSKTILNAWLEKC